MIFLNLYTESDYEVVLEYKNDHQPMLQQLSTDETSWHRDAQCDVWRSSLYKTRAQRISLEMVVINQTML